MAGSPRILRIFLSSTSVDLATHRQAVRDIIARLGHFTIAMEHFGAQDGDAQSVSLEQLAAADLFVGVVAWRYGYIPAGQDCSVTQQEYQEATKLGLPRYLYLADPATQAADSPADLFPAALRDPDHLERLLNFRDQITRERVVDYFTSPDNLAAKVGAALHQYVQAHPLAADSQPPHDLPPRAPNFVGRERELEAVTTGLRHGHVIAVVGMGGLGKSSLAGEAVSALAAEPTAFPGGVTWVRCDERVGLEGLIWILDQVLAAWQTSVPAEAAARAASQEDALALRERALQKRLSATSSTSSAPALVFLDNVEHGLPLVRLLQTLQPLGVTPLLTMRSEPSSPQAQLLRLGALPIDVAIELFTERYTARGGEWVAERDGTAADAIVQALGALPLAIELAAARAARTRLPLTALAQELQTSEVLSRLSDPLNPSASVRYSLGKTLSTLSSTQRLRFAALGAPDGADWPQAVIVELCASVPARRSETIEEGVAMSATAQADLDALVAYSLVGQVAGDAPGELRVRLHPLVRELAREQWASLPIAEQGAALHALLTAVKAWVVRHLDTSATGFTVVARDEDLIAGTVRAAVARQIDLPQVIDLTEAWGEALYIRNFPLTLEISKLQLQTARALGDRRAEMVALRALARASVNMGLLDDMRRYQQEALSIAREAGDRVALLRQLAVVGANAAELGLFDDARRMHEEASAIAREFGDQLTDWNALSGLGTLARSLRRLPEAEQWYQRATASALADGNQFTEARSQTDLGFVYALMGNFAAAQQIHEGLLVRTRPFGHILGLAVQLNALGQLALKTGDLAAAASYLSEALPIAEELGGLEFASQVRGNLAALRGLEALRKGNRAAAKQAYQDAEPFLDRPLGLPAADQLPFVHHLLAELAEQPAESASAPTSEQPGADITLPPAAEPVMVANAASAPTQRARRRWWPWGR
jgi:tetratricopeptide (TPR) repeat protein